ncbi:MAG: hypothetical protein SFT94_07635 [Pseudanabaenaceae cyanobacterium bins.68]|nr:hypothetical protein [Pseudanabaenaceae cyanobacterium bins.68]
MPTISFTTFFYYIEGLPSARVAPDLMVVFGIAPGMRPNYKIWQEGVILGVIFEITSPSTRENDLFFKKNLSGLTQPKLGTFVKREFEGKALKWGVAPHPSQS